MAVINKEEGLKAVKKLLSYTDTEAKPWLDSYASDLIALEKVSAAPKCNGIRERRARLKLAECLLSHYNEPTVDKTGEILLMPREIESVLIDRKNGTIFPSILEVYRDLGMNMRCVNFNNLYLQGCDFTGLKNVKINLDKVKNKDLLGAKFDEVEFTGSFKNFVICNTQFNKCKSESPIDPQELRINTLRNSKLSGIEIKGSLDKIDISGTDFSEAKGTIVINPQKFLGKRIYKVNFKNCFIVGDYNNSTGQFEEASFTGCEIDHTSFAGARNIPVMDIDEIRKDKAFHKKMITNTELSGVRIVGTIEDICCDYGIFDNCVINGKKFTLRDTTTFQHLKLVQVDWLTAYHRMEEELITKQKRKSLFGFLKNICKK